MVRSCGRVVRHGDRLSGGSGFRVLRVAGRAQHPRMTTSAGEGRDVGGDAPYLLLRGDRVPARIAELPLQWGKTVDHVRRRGVWRERYRICRRTTWA